MTAKRADDPRRDPRPNELSHPPRPRPSPLQKNDQIPPGSALRKAAGSTLAQWPKLIRCLEHGERAPDTNACDQVIRPFVVGRRNWLSCSSHRGAQASATLYSIIETAKPNGLEMYWYLRKPFEGLPTVASPQGLLRVATFAAPKV